jgi:hypothetical protein
MYFSMAETFVTMFTRQKMLAVGWDDLRNFAVEEKCALIAQQGTTKCGLNPGLVERLRALRHSAPPPSAAEYLRPIRAVEKPPRNVHIFDPDRPEQLELEELYHVILELRKIPLATSPSAMLGVLSNAIHWLTTALHMAAGQKIGADEIFQFFVFCVSVAKLWCLPGLISFVDSFIDEALRETKFEYYIQQMRSALEFIEGMVIPVPPFVLLPNYDLPLRLARRLELVSEETVLKKGFEVYAFPIWARECELFFPAMLRYTGTEAIAVCRQYKIIEGALVVPGMKPIVTLDGTFFQLTSEYLNEKQLIKVDGGDYAAAYEDLALVSAMIQMLGCNVANPSIGAIDKLIGHVARMWRMETVLTADGVNRKKGEEAVQRHVGELQRALVVLEILPMTFPLDGKMNLETVEAMKAFFQQNGRTKLEFTLDRRFFFEAIVAASRRKA